MRRVALASLALVALAACKRGEPAASQPARRPAAASAPACAGGGTWSAGPYLATARGHHVAELLPADRVLVVGGRGNIHDPQGHTTGMEVLDLRPGRDLTVYRQAPRRVGHTLTRLPDGRVVLVGGTEAEAPMKAKGTWLFDPAADRWSFPAGPGGVPPVYHTATLLPDGSVLLAGGRANGFPVSPAQAEAALYDPARDTTRALPPLHEARAGHTATRLADGRVLVVGGWSRKGLLGDAEVFDPATGRWARLPGATPRADHTATLLADGRVLLVGGADGGATHFFDPRTNRFGAAPPPAEPARRGHTATLLAGGAVLVVGGYGRNRALASAALFDPGAGTWCEAMPLATARYGHAATRLGDGRVVVTGGSDPADDRPRMDPYVRSTEVFTPAPR